MELIDFYKQYGHTRVSTVQSPQSRLSKWLRTQRSLRQSGLLSPERAHRLAVLGLHWRPREKAWDAMLDELAAFKAVHGSCDVPQVAPEEVAKLGRWVHKQRVRYRRGALSESRVRRLEDLGLAWNKREARWREMFDALSCVKTTDSSMRGPSTTRDPALRTWLRNQRTAFRSGRLSADRIRQLRNIGVDLGP
jgi:hypothetical protein